MGLDTRDPKVQKFLLGGLLLGAILYAFLFTTWVPFTYKATASQVSALQEQYLDMSKDLNKARQATHRLPYLEKEYALLHRKWEQSQALLPEEQEMAWCLRTISLLGSQSGVEFTLFKPLPPRPAQYHTENPIEIKVVGGYHEVGVFLAELANLDRVINVTHLEILTSKEKDSDAPAEASFVAVTYTLGGTGVAPEEQAEPGKRQKVRQVQKNSEGPPPQEGAAGPTRREESNE